jgi:hypothetical protein
MQKRRGDTETSYIVRENSVLKGVAFFVGAVCVRHTRHTAHFATTPSETIKHPVICLLPLVSRPRGRSEPSGCGGGSLATVADFGSRAFADGHRDQRAAKKRIGDESADA